MLCEFASGARGTFEASRTIVGPESQMAFEVYGTKGALSWNLEQLNELQVYLAEDELHTGYRTVFGGDRFPYHGNFVPGSANGIGFEDLVVIEDFEFLRSRRRAAARTRRASTTRWRSCACRRRCCESVRSGPLGGRVDDRDATATLRHRRDRRRPDRPHARRAARAPGARARRVAAVYDAARRTARARRAELGVPARRASRSCSAPPTSTRSRSASSTDTHADLIVAAARRGQGDLLREADLARPRRGRPRAGRRRRGRRAVPDRLQPPLRPRPRRRCATPSPRGEVGEPQLVRISSRDPAPPPLEYVRALGRDLPRHDDPRLRHGPLRRRAARSSRSTPAARCASTRRSREADDVDTALVTLVHANGCLTAIDNSRQAVYGYDQRVEVFGSRGMAASENPLAHTARRAHRDGTRAADAAVLLPRALHPELPARVGGVRATPSRTGATPPVTGRRRPRAARHRPRRLAVAARGTAGPPIERGRRGVDAIWLTGGIAASSARTSCEAFDDVLARRRTPRST